MLKRDYVLDMVEQFSRVLAQVIGLGEATQFSEARDEAARAADEYLGLTRSQLQTLPAKALIAHVHTGEPEKDVARWYLLTELLLVLGDLERIEGKEYEGVVYYLKAMDVATDVARMEERLPYFVPLIERISYSLGDYFVPVPIGQNLFECLERSEQYGAAEDLLFDLLEQTDNDPEIVELGLGYYDRLAQIGEFKLRTGGLSREEVDEGLAELMALQRAG